MELRKDPITRSWVLTGESPESKPPAGQAAGACPFCPESGAELQVVSYAPPVTGGPWSARSVVHPAPVYRIEGDATRQGNGLYDTMRTVGAHEVLLENPRHDCDLWQASDVEIEQFLRLAAQRILDLKRDRRFKYVTLFKNHGKLGGQDIAHPHWELTATTFVPRRVLYELRSCRDHFQRKERCVFCDILGQEERQKQRLVEARGNYLACCPYAPRVPYETWLLPLGHESSFERGMFAKDARLRDLATLLRRTLLRIRAITDSFHMVLHTMPNTLRKSNILGYWGSIDDDYHWHFEILPIVPGRSRSYTFKETYYSDITSEEAAARLRAVALS